MINVCQKMMLRHKLSIEIREFCLIFFKMRIAAHFVSLQGRLLLLLLLDAVSKLDMVKAFSPSWLRILRYDFLCYSFNIWEFDSTQISLNPVLEGHILQLGSLVG